MEENRQIWSRVVVCNNSDLKTLQGFYECNSRVTYKHFCRGAA